MADPDSGSPQICILFYALFYPMSFRKKLGKKIKKAKYFISKAGIYIMQNTMVRGGGMSNRGN